jgi:uncharacterized phage-like protein YoqJ
MQKEKVCCIAGPEQLPVGIDEEWVKQRLEAEIRRMVTYEGVTCFYIGMRPCICQWAAEIVLQLKKEYPSVKLKCVLSCETLANDWTELQRDLFYAVMEHCDEELLLQGEYTSDCEKACAKFLVKRCTSVLAVWDGVEIGNTGMILLYARREGREIRLIKLLTPKQN